MHRRLDFAGFFIASLRLQNLSNLEITTKKLPPKRMIAFLLFCNELEFSTRLFFQIFDRINVLHILRNS